MMILVAMLGCGLLSLATHGTRLGYFNENGFNIVGAMFVSFGALLIGIICGMIQNKISEEKNNGK